MARLAILGVAFGLAFSRPAEAEPLALWSQHVGEASRRFGLPASWIWRVIQLESGGRTEIAGRPITSPAGAMGLMQLMPGTWAEMRARHGLGADPHNPRDNILAGTAYLRLMYDRFGFPGLFAAYNAGAARYSATLLTGRPLPLETRLYLQNAVAVAGLNGRTLGVSSAQKAPPRRASGARNPASSALFVAAGSPFAPRRER